MRAANAVAADEDVVADEDEDEDMDEDEDDRRTDPQSTQQNEHKREKREIRREEVKRAEIKREQNNQTACHDHDEQTDRRSGWRPAGAREALEDDLSFQPGQPARRMSKSQAPDIATRVHEDIAHGLYECPICTNEVMRNSKVWSCKMCWTVFHLSCIKKWSKNDGSTQKQTEETAPRQWRCPGCNLPTDELPTGYQCWCGKDLDPKPIPGNPPHSCGSTCSKPRARCPHPCPDLCHAGPCPPCLLMGPSQPCFCGKEVSTKRCLDTKYDQGWSCDSICGELLPCGVHTCEQKCHEGLCGSCEVAVPARCYCGKSSTHIKCSEQGESRESTTSETWTGSFDCGAVCGRPYDCGKHACQQNCHPQSETAPCPMSPDVVTHCPCGKTPIDQLRGPRTSCEDEIPHCQEICQKLLACGHRCQSTCHDGECASCQQRVLMPCRCGRTESSTLCFYRTDELPQCFRICKATLNCGRHECGEHCCPGEKRALERARRKRTGPEDVEAEHICTRICGRPLKCGDEEHLCQELCHRGPCGTCREAIFDEISCHCGRTILHPPLPCGTQPPPCTYPCNRPPTCGHPQVAHNCHGDTEACPKCPFLVERTCMCGKKVLKNQPCWFNDAACGILCDKLLRCGAHRCLRSCHRGPCEVDNTCKQLCGRPKACGHPDLSSLCHSPYPCKEDQPCQSKIFITCECQHKKQEVKCLATKTEAGSAGKVLSCDDECLRLQRNAKLAAALSIDPTHTDDHIPYSKTTLDAFKKDSTWCQTQEREFRVFAALDERRLRFKPMKATQRAFIHSLAEDFGLDSESMDPEPHRHVCVFKTPRFVSAPTKTLAQCARIRPVEAPRAVTAPALPWNAFVLSSPQFGLTIDEVRRAVDEFGTFTVSFLPSEEIVLVGDADVVPVKSRLESKVKSLQLATATSLCHVDSSLNILRRDNSGGWSQVAKGTSRPAPTAAAVGKTSSFAVLRKKREEEDVADSWETAMDDDQA